MAQVNRLTRELAALRAHTASVASTSSSATTSSAMLQHDAAADLVNGGLLPLAPPHPALATPARRHRSSSSVSRAGPAGRYPGPAPAQTQQPDAARRHGRSASLVIAPRYEEMARYRQGLDEAKRENEALRCRVRELERTLARRLDGKVNGVHCANGSGANGQADASACA